MKRLFVFTYPKLTLYVIGIFVAYFVFQIPQVYFFVTSLDSLLYLEIFFGGLLYTAGFTSPLATGFFLAIRPSNLMMASLIGGLGALVADIGIFSFVRLSFMNEFKRLKHTSFMKHLSNGFEKIPNGLRTFLVYVFAAILIASPLPDELGVAMLAGFTRVHPYAFGAMSLIGNMIGILTLLSI